MADFRKHAPQWRFAGGSQQARLGVIARASMLEGEASVADGSGGVPIGKAFAGGTNTTGAAIPTAARAPFAHLLAEMGPDAMTSFLPPAAGHPSALSSPAATPTARRRGGDALLFAEEGGRFGADNSGRGRGPLSAALPTTAASASSPLPTSLQRQQRHLVSAGGGSNAGLRRNHAAKGRAEQRAMAFIGNTQLRPAAAQSGRGALGLGGSTLVAASQREGHDHLPMLHTAASTMTTAAATMTMTTLSGSIRRNQANNNVNVGSVSHSRGSTQFDQSPHSAATAFVGCQLDAHARSISPHHAAEKQRQQRTPPTAAAAATKAAAESPTTFFGLRRREVSSVAPLSRSLSLYSVGAGRGGGGGVPLPHHPSNAPPLLRATTESTRRGGAVSAEFQTPLQRTRTPQPPLPPPHPPHIRLSTGCTCQRPPPSAPLVEAVAAIATSRAAAAAAPTVAGGTAALPSRLASVAVGRSFRYPPFRRLNHRMPLERTQLLPPPLPLRSTSPSNCCCSKASTRCHRAAWPPPPPPAGLTTCTHTAPRILQRPQRSGRALRIAVRPSLLM